MTTTIEFGQPIPFPEERGARFEAATDAFMRLILHYEHPELVVPPTE